MTCQVCHKAGVVIDGYPYCGEHLPRLPEPLVGINAIPPQDLEAEQALLGWLLMEPKRWAQVEGVVRPTDFYRDGHRAMYECVGEAYAYTRKFLSQNLLRRLRERDVASLMSPCVMEALKWPDPVECAEIVAEMARRREAIERGLKLIEAAYAWGK